ncbi:MAG TPA: hypothetical protein VF420_10065 [Casimicrobiaceae bacterium]
MNDSDAQRIIRLLEEIRDAQRLQLERQARAIDTQREVLGAQRERFAGLGARAESAQNLGDQAQRVLTGSAQLVRSARALLLVAIPFAIVLLAFVVWILFARLAG